MFETYVRDHIVKAIVKTIDIELAKDEEENITDRDDLVEAIGSIRCLDLESNFKARYKKNSKRHLPSNQLEMAPKNKPVLP